jgi:tetratricopeptide (TPR) repeat protein
VRAFVCLLMVATLQAADFELTGRVLPDGAFTVVLEGAITPFRAKAETDRHGRFRFRKLLPGPYTVMIAGFQQTVDVSPKLADAKGRIDVTLDLRGYQLESAASVSVRDLAIPKEARRQYAEAGKKLERRDVAGAIYHLRRAVELAPNYSAAWNHLGTIAYQTRKYADAETYFRKGLDTDPEAYPPLVNLGGVLINLARWDEALEYNRRAVLKKPADALANSQLGMAYFFAGKLDQAENYLLAAKRIDPSHFSHPQLLLARIHLRRNEPRAAATELEDLVERHPDLPDAVKIKDEITRLRAAP